MVCEGGWPVRRASSGTQDPVSLRGRLLAITGPDLAEEARQASCLACDAGELIAFYEAPVVPAQTCVLLDHESEAIAYPSGSLLLAFCERCGFIQNVRFDPEIVDYSMPTEESQAFSNRFNVFASALADDLVARLGLEGRSLLELGCGKGDFLRLMVDRGMKPALGIDPGFLPNRDEFGPDVEFRRDWFGPSDTHLTADLVISRHLMEHVPNVKEFFGWIAESASRTKGSMVFTEVPDTARVLREGAFWDVYHEHCSYFTLGSLARSLRQVGMSVTRLEYGFDGQYLLAESSLWESDAVPSREDTPEEIGKLVESFAVEAEAGVDRWRDRIRSVAASGEKVAIWGGGSKAVAFLSSLGVSDVDVVDINPHKQGTWLPGTRVQIREPGDLEEIQPTLVIPMNPVYVDEIRRDLDVMGLSPKLIPV